jgi:hypothetical protein
VLRDSRLEISWSVCYLSVLVVFESAVVCFNFGCREVTQLRGRKEIRIIRCDLYLIFNNELREWLHVITYKMNYTNEECADMHLFLGEERGKSTEAERL